MLLSWHRGIQSSQCRKTQILESLTCGAVCFYSRPQSRPNTGIRHLLLFRRDLINLIPVLWLCFDAIYCKQTQGTCLIELRRYILRVTGTAKTETATRTSRPWYRTRQTGRYSVKPQTKLKFHFQFEFSSLLVVTYRPCTYRYHPKPLDQLTRCVTGANPQCHPTFREAPPKWST